MTCIQAGAIYPDIFQTFLSPNQSSRVASYSQDEVKRDKLTLDQRVPSKISGPKIWYVFSQARSTEYKFTYWRIVFFIKWLFFKWSNGIGCGWFGWFLWSEEGGFCGFCVDLVTHSDKKRERRKKWETFGEEEEMELRKRKKDWLLFRN